MKSTLGHLSSVLIIALAAREFALSASASESFPRPIFTEDRRFSAEATRAATRLGTGDLPFSVLAFDRALARCGMSAADLQAKLLHIFSKESGIWGTLDLLIPDSRETIRKLNVTLLVDDFTDYAGPNPAFSSYYLRSSQPVIGLDCSGIRPRYWLSSIAHEITHAFFEGRDAESWWEEGVAQLLEDQAGGPQPALTLKHLEKARTLPPLLEKRRPLPSRESYAISYLFARYLKQQLGGWPALRAISSRGPDECEASDDDLDRLACRARAYLLNQQRSYVQTLAPEKVTRNGLLRYFYVALSLNARKSPAYFIEGWGGLNRELLPNRASPLLPGQAQVLALGTPLREIHASYEAYRVQLRSDGAFRIWPRADFTQAPEEPTDFLLVISLKAPPQTPSP